MNLRERTSYNVEIEM